MDTGRSGSAAELNAANCITIGLVNNMPDAALEATERQFTDLLRAATPNAVVLLKLFAMPEVPRGEAVRAAIWPNVIATLPSCGIRRSTA